MRLTILILVSFCFSAPAYGQGAGVVFVQATGKSSTGSSSSLAVPFSSNTAAGDLILVGFDFTTSVTSFSVTDSQGNVFTAVGSQLTSPAGVRSRVYFAKNIKGGADTVTVKLSAISSCIEVYLTEYKGVDSTNPIDAQVGATGNSGAVTSGNATTTVAGDLIYGYCVGDWACTAGSGFATRSNLDDNLIETEQAAKSGTYAATGSANKGWTMQMVALKPASPSGGSPPAITSATSARGALGAHFSYQITATNSPTSFGASGLLAGLTVDTSTGLISGTPSSAGTSTVALSATNSAGTGKLNLTLTTASSQEQFIALSSNRKYLINPSTGQPVFLVGDAPQLLSLQLSSTTDIEQYLSDRQARGFNAIWVILIDQLDQDNAPKDALGNSPFLGEWFSATEDPAYWAHQDDVITRAGNHGMTVFAQPSFVGNADSQPAYDTPALLAASDATVTAYGAWVGNRYKDYPNIVWVLGGDYDSSHATIKTKVTDMATGIASVDPNHLITIEACRYCSPTNQSSLDSYGSSPPSFLGLNWVYSQQPNVVAVSQKNFSRSPFLPPFVGEDFYELEHSMTAFLVREEGYWEVLSGSYVGRLFGNGPIWSFNAKHSEDTSPSWQSQLSSGGSVGQEIMGALFRSREHWLLVPDVNHTVVTAGYGSGSTLTTTARTSDGQSIISYIPNGNATTITVNLAEITSSRGTLQAWWFNPQTGAATSLGTFPNSGTQNFTPPDSNDWVLVLDDASANLPAPGTSTASSS